MKKEVLIVDDEKAIRELLSTALERTGFIPVTAASAEEAIEILKTNQIPCMYLDLKLPGMSGLELCRKIRKDNPMACIHAMTGYGKVFELMDCREAGFDDYFLKPLSLKVFLESANDSFKKIERWRRKE